MQPKRYRALHITPGVVDYTEGAQRETVLIKKPCLDAMNPSFLGKPVFNYTHKVIEAEVAFNFTSEESEKHAVGVISDVGYDVESGYYWADMMIWDEETQENIKKGYGVSNAYIPEVGPGGIYNNVPYDEEVESGEYHHMAIVEEPRYGDVRIFENSKKGKLMRFKLFGGKEKEPVKKNAADPPPKEKKEEKKEEEMEMNADSTLVDEEGDEYVMSELVAAWKSANPKKNAKPTMNMEDTIEIDGKDVSVKDLYDNIKSKKNAEPATDDPLEPVVDPSLKKNSADDGEKEKENEHFKKLKINAKKAAEPVKIKVNTQASRIKKGRLLYGSPVKNAAGGN